MTSTKRDYRDHPDWEHGCPFCKGTGIMRSLYGWFQPTPCPVCRKDECNADGPAAPGD
jgi:hypothetical protein